jgi:hypothetical protein
MHQLINQFATKNGISTKDAESIFSFIEECLIKKIPQLQRLIEDIFENAGDQRLKEHLEEAIREIERQLWNEKFKDYQVPSRSHHTHQDDGGLLF